MTTKSLFIAFFVFGCVEASRAQTPGYVMNSSNQAVHLDTTDGRKILFVILPTQADTGLIGQLIRFQNKHGQQLRIFGIIASGAAGLASAVSQSSYLSLPAAGIILTVGISVTDSAAGSRSAILQYLTRKSNNRGVDGLAEGAKYFLSENGRMFAMLGKDDSLDSNVATYIVQAAVPGGKNN